MREFVTRVRVPAPLIAAIVCALLWNDAGRAMDVQLQRDGPALCAIASNGPAALTTAHESVPDAADPVSDCGQQDAEAWLATFSVLAAPEHSRDRPSSFTDNALIRFDLPPKIRVSRHLLQPTCVRTEQVVGFRICLSCGRCAAA